MEIRNSLHDYSLRSLSFTSVSKPFVCVTDLPMTPESVPRTEQRLIIAKGLLNGNKEVSFLADSWDLQLSPQHKPAFMLRRSINGEWFELHNPAHEYLEMVKSILVAAYFLNIIKQRPNAPIRAVWLYVREECRATNMNPDLDDLKESAKLIKSVFRVDPILQQSPILRELYAALGNENTQQEVPDVPEEVPQPNCREENEDEGHVSRDYSILRYSLPAQLNVPVLAEPGSSSGLHLTSDSAPQALDTPVLQVPGTGQLTLQAAPGYFARKRTQGLVPEDPKLRCVNEFYGTPIPLVIPAQDPGLSSLNDVNRIPIASRPEAQPGLSTANVEVFQTPGIASLIRPQSEPSWLGEISGSTPTAQAVIQAPESEPNCPHEDEGLNLPGVYSKRSPGVDLPVLAGVATGEATVAEGSSSGLHPTRDLATQALDTPVDVSRAQHLATPAPGGKGNLGIAGDGVAGEGIAGEGNAGAGEGIVGDGDAGAGEGIVGDGDATQYTKEELANWVDEPDVCAFCDDGGDYLLLCCHYCMRSFHPTPASGLHTKCPSLRLSRPLSEIENYLCPNCEAKQHQCFACGKLGNSDPASPIQVFECDARKCKRFYHPRCVVKLLNSPEVQEVEADGIEQKQKTFTCPLHKCEKCNKPRITGLVKCRRCPRAWHKKCLPEGSRMWKCGDKYVMYCDKHDIEKVLEASARDHIVFPKAGERRGRETQEPSGGSGTEPASDNLSTLGTQPRVEGPMANTRKVVRRKLVKGIALAYPPPTLPPNVENISDSTTLQRVEKKPRRYIPQRELEEDD